MCVLRERCRCQCPDFKTDQRADDHERDGASQIGQLQLCEDRSGAQTVVGRHGVGRQPVEIIFIERLSRPLIPGKSSSVSAHQLQLTGDDRAPECILSGNGGMAKPLFNTVLGHPAQLDQRDCNEQESGHHHQDQTCLQGHGNPTSPSTALLHRITCGLPIREPEAIVKHPGKFPTDSRSRGLRAARAFGSITVHHHCLVLACHST